MFRTKRTSLLRLLILLTTLFVIAQIVFAITHGYVTGMMDIARLAITSKLFFTWAVIPPLAGFVFAQLIIYSLLVYSLWYISTSISQLFRLSYISSLLLGVTLWLCAITTIIFLNTSLVTHSLFTEILRSNVFADAISDEAINNIIKLGAGLLLLAIGLTSINLCINLYRKQHLTREGIMLSLLLGGLLILRGPAFFVKDKQADASRFDKPNIIVIGFDALRPDFLTFFNKEHAATPNFDRFLKSATVFTENYTPIARTSPSWVGILTGKYPLHHQIRENNTYLQKLDFANALPATLKKAGYETIYATDDKLFNLIDERFGFDKVIAPKGTVADYLLSAISDFPLSNLVIPTPFGKLLFPYNHANHAASITYHPDNFLALLAAGIANTTNKPLFLAVHFDVSGWPFYYFNDQQPYNKKSLACYDNAIIADDTLLGKFLALLDKNKLLNHAIVILVSDHGITVGAHGDRVTAKKLYQGDARDMKVLRARYADTTSVYSQRKFWTDAKNITATLNPNNYGVDTSYGYGGDVLSLKQYQTLFAIRGFGLKLGEPRQISGRTNLLDITPTLLDVLQLAKLSTDGISLKPYLLNAKLTLPARRFYFETAFSPAEIEQQQILVYEVVSKNLQYFYINPNTGEVNLQPGLTRTLVEKKQRAVLDGDWLLAYYPISQRFGWLPYLDKHKKVNWQIGTRLIPAYSVLVNIKDGKWTTETHNTFIERAPLVLLKTEINGFYGNEMRVYQKTEL